MLTLIHGDDTAASRKFFTDLKHKSPDGIVLEGAVSITDVTQALEGGELFSDTKTLFIEQFVAKKKSQSDYKTIVAYLSDQGKSANIFLWEGKELEISTTAAFKNAVIKPFKLPQSLFLFLDEIKPGNGTKLVKLFHQTLATVEVEAILPMMIRQIRLLLALHTPSSPLLAGEGQGEVQIDEVKRLTWQKDKLKKQARTFQQEELLALHKQLFAIEVAQKTGGIPVSLISSIDILLISI